MAKNFKNIACIKTEINKRSVVPLILVILAIFSLWHSDVLFGKRATKPYYPKLEFAISALNSLQKNNPNENIFYSPHSVYQALLVTYFGAAGNTERDLERVLGIKNKTDVQSGYKLEVALRAKQSQNESFEFASVDKLYVSNRITLKDSVKKLLDDHIEQLNFADEPENSIQHINKFIEEVTRNNFKNALKVDQSTKSTQFAIVNAAYFKGEWVSKFDETTTKAFYRHGVEPENVEMMLKEGDFKYGLIKNSDTQFLRMPYKGEDERFSMYVFLPPKDPDAIDELLYELTPHILDDVFNSVHQKILVNVYFPKFGIEKSSDMVRVLEKMGVHHLFNEANFSNIYECNDTQDECLLKTNMKHVAKVEVDELGSVAAAFTYGNFAYTGAKYSKPKDFHCDHPFVFIIHDEKFKEIVFAGVYRGPNYI